MANIVSIATEVVGYTSARLSERGGRAAGRAMAWTAVGTPVVLVTYALLAAGGRWEWSLAVGLLGPILLGVGVGLTMPGVGGWVFGLIGTAVGSVPFWVGLLVAGIVEVRPDDILLDMVAQLVLQLLLAPLLITLLLAAQLGVGVVLGSVLDGIRRRDG
ncbi:MAG TPA: hypothetical protein VLA23_12425 [Candidatus Limnocylindrales bacterium]|nr:hypothetical protein [Candidatus Limnocylindrales bacterium]